MAEAIRDGLRLQAIAADIAGDGDTAVELLRINTYDIAVLDRDIPGPSGDEIARTHRGFGQRHADSHADRRRPARRQGLRVRAGRRRLPHEAVRARELVLRLRALDRRRAHNRPPVREIAGLRLDPFRREVHRDGRYVSLTRKQFAVLEVLVSQKVASSAPKSSWNGHGTRTPTRSRTPSASRSRPSANDWVSPGSSPPWPASDTASESIRLPEGGRRTWIGPRV